MKLTDFHFELPKHLIAQYPTAQRTDSRLLLLDGTMADCADKHFPDIIDLIDPGDPGTFIWREGYRRSD